MPLRRCDCPRARSPASPADEGVRDPTLAAIERFFTGYAAKDRDGIASALAEEIEWTIPATIPCPGTKREIDEVLACFAALDSVGFKAETFFVQAGDDDVVDSHRGSFMGDLDSRSTRPGRPSGTWTAPARSTGSSTSPATSTRWTRSSGANLPLKPLPERLVG